MSRIKSKKQLIEEIVVEQDRLDELLSQIPGKEKVKPEVVDGMSVKDILAHRTQWGKMFIGWYTRAKAGKTPAVPSKEYKWNQLKELNAEIYRVNKSRSLKSVEQDFKRTQKKLYKMIKEMKEKELLEKGYYKFTGASNLAIYAGAATSSHYRSARRHIQKWWRAKSK